MFFAQIHVVILSQRSSRIFSKLGHCDAFEWLHQELSCGLTNTYTKPSFFGSI